MCENNEGTPAGSDSEIVTGGIETEVKRCGNCKNLSVIGFDPSTGKPAPRPYCFRCGSESA